MTVSNYKNNIRWEEERLRTKENCLEQEIKSRVEEEVKPIKDKWELKFDQIKKKDAELEVKYKEKRKRLLKGNLALIVVMFFFLLISISLIKKGEIDRKEAIIHQYQSNQYYICVNSCDVKLQDGTSVSCGSGTNVILLEDNGETIEIISENGKIGYISYVEWIQNFKEYDPFLLKSAAY